MILAVCDEDLSGKKIKGKNINGEEIEFFVNPRFLVM